MYSKLVAAFLMLVVFRLRPISSQQASNLNQLCKQPEVSDVVALNKCLQQLGMTAAQLTAAYVDQVKGNSYDDKCLAKCFYTERMLLNADGTPNYNAILAQVTRMLPAQKLAEATPKIQDCLLAAETQVAMLGGVLAQPCKYAAMLGVCLNDRIFDPFCKAA